MATRRHRPRVLLADNHREVAALLGVILSDEFDLVGTVADGLALVEAATLLKPDVVVADISMPRLDGVSALIELKKRGSDVKVVLVTMHQEPAFARAALSSGAHGLVLKDEAAHQLTTAVRAALAGRTYVSPALIRQSG